MNNQLNFYVLLTIVSLGSSPVLPKSVADCFFSFIGESSKEEHTLETLETNLREAIKPVLESTQTSLECKYAIEDIIREQVILPAPTTFESLNLKHKVIDEGRAICEQKPFIIIPPITTIADDYPEKVPADSYSDYARECFEWIREQINLNYDNQPVLTYDQALAGAGYICVGVGIYYLLQAARLDWNSYWETKARLKKLKEELQARESGDKPRCICHVHPCIHSQSKQSSAPTIIEPITPEQIIPT